MTVAETYSHRVASYYLEVVLLAQTWHTTPLVASEPAKPVSRIVKNLET
jgi:hypothetical protein